MSVFRPRQAMIPLLLALVFLSCETSSHLPQEKRPGGSGSKAPVTTESSDESGINTDDWTAAKSLVDLVGKWESSGDSIYEYPFKVDGKKYMRIAWSECDDTPIWKAYALKKGCDMQTLWQIRFSCISDIYGQNLPIADANGTQYGIKLSQRDGRIYSRREMLVSERLLLVNLGFFLISPDKDLFVEKGTLRLASDNFDDLSSGGNIYRRKNGGE
ncbi:MAG: hypothetical protein IJU95_01870 [Treponema sp.]|nr:hypothetical protein [Treponema sp.]